MKHKAELGFYRSLFGSLDDKRLFRDCDTIWGLAENGESPFYCLQPLQLF